MTTERDGDTQQQALARVRRFCEMWRAKPLAQMDDRFYGIHVGTEWEAELSVRDLEVLIAPRPSTRPTERDYHNQDQPPIELSIDDTSLPFAPSTAPTCNMGGGCAHTIKCKAQGRCEYPARLSHVAATEEYPSPLDTLDWNRLRSGNYRALNPENQPLFDIFFAQSATLAPSDTVAVPTKLLRELLDHPSGMQRHMAVNWDGHELLALDCVLTELLKPTLPEAAMDGTAKQP